MILQTTLASPTDWVCGGQLDRPHQAGVRLCPAPAEAGIVFVRRDLPGHPTIACCVENLSPQARWTALQQNGAWVHHTEHLLAAIAGEGLDNVLIELDSDRVPIVTGGSCLGFAHAIRRAGLQPLAAPRRAYRLRRPVHERMALSTPPGQAAALEADVTRYIVGLPADSFAVSYVFHVPHLAGLRVALAELDASPFGEAITSARTYYLQSEQAQVEQLLSDVRHDFIVLSPESPQALVDEVARHKVVDFVGDLMILGRRVLGRFVAFRSGHRLHHQLAQALMAADCLELIDCPD